MNTNLRKAQKHLQRATEVLNQSQLGFGGGGSKRSSSTELDPTESHGTDQKGMKLTRSNLSDSDPLYEKATIEFIKEKQAEVKKTYNCYQEHEPIPGHTWPDGMCDTVTALVVQGSALHTVPLLSQFGQVGTCRIHFWLTDGKGMFFDPTASQCMPSFPRDFILVGERKLFENNGYVFVANPPRVFGDVMSRTIAGLEKWFARCPCQKRSKKQKALHP